MINKGVYDITWPFFKSSFEQSLFATIGTIALTGHEVIDTFTLPCSQVAPAPLLFKQIAAISHITCKDYCPALNIFCLLNGRESQENLENVVLLSFIV